MYRKNTSGQFLHFGFVNVSTGAALASATITGVRSIDGGSTAYMTSTFYEQSPGGLYRVTLSQADTNGNDISYFFTATNAIPVTLNIVTTAADPTDTVRFGLTALPNVASGSAGAIITSGIGTAQLDVSSGIGRVNLVMVDTNTLTSHASGKVPADVLTIAGTTQTARDIGASVLLSSGTGAGQVDLSSGQVKVQQGTSAGQLDTSSGQVKVQAGVASGQIDAASGIVRANLVMVDSTTLTSHASGKAPADVLMISGTTQTARDIGASVLVSPGTGVGQLDLNGGAIKLQSNFKKNVAFNNFMFLMTDSTTHLPATSKTVTATRAIDGGNFGAGTLSAVTEIGSGVYGVNFGAGDLNGSNIMLVPVSQGCDLKFIEIVTDP